MKIAAPSSTTSDAKEAYVWAWLPGETAPVVAGRLFEREQGIAFSYTESYLERAEAIPLYETELPLQRGFQAPIPGLAMPGCIRDASPDAWGRRAIIHAGRLQDEVASELTFLLNSGSDRIGFLDFQRSADECAPSLPHEPTCEDLAEVVERIEKGLPLSPAMAQVIKQAASVGGARPKALVTNEDQKLIAKFSSCKDLHDQVGFEFVAMRLASLAGLHVAEVELVETGATKTLLVERFDRVKSDEGWTRRGMVSAAPPNLSKPDQVRFGGSRTHNPSHPSALWCCVLPRQ